MLRRRIGIAAAQSAAPIVVHPLEMHGIDGVLLALKPIARNVREHDFAKAVGPGERFPYRQFRRGLRPEISEQQSGAFLHRIGLGVTAGLRRFRIGGILVRLFEAAAGLVDEPAVIAAADAVVLDPAVGHVGAAVRTVPVDQAVTAAQILVENEIFAQKADGFDRIGVEFAGAGDGLPIAAQQLAHGRAGSDAREHFVTGGSEQAFLPLVLVSDDYSISCRVRGEGTSISRPVKSRPRVGRRLPAHADRAQLHQIKDNFLSAVQRFWCSMCHARRRRNEPASRAHGSLSRIMPARVAAGKRSPSAAGRRHFDARRHCLLVVSCACYHRDHVWRPCRHRPAAAHGQRRQACRSGG